MVKSPEANKNLSKVVLEKSIDHSAESSVASPVVSVPFRLSCVEYQDDDV